MLDLPLCFRARRVGQKDVQRVLEVITRGNVRRPEVEIQRRDVQEPAKQLSLQIQSLNNSVRELHL